MTGGTLARHLLAPSDEGRGDVPSPDEHREDVVRRLLDRGLSPTALRTMLPTFDDVIDRVLAERGDDGRDQPQPGSDGP
jgi:hypothetical protein